MANPYKLDKAKHKEVYSKIADDYLSRAETQEPPRVIITGGQPGSGKGRLARRAAKTLKASGSCVLIDVDELRKEHPLHKQLQQENDREAGYYRTKITNIEAKTKRESADYRLEMARVNHQLRDLRAQLPVQLSKQPCRNRRTAQCASAVNAPKVRPAIWHRKTPG